MPKEEKEGDESSASSCPDKALEAGAATVLALPKLR